MDTRNKQKEPQNPKPQTVEELLQGVKFKALPRVNEIPSTIVIDQSEVEIGGNFVIKLNIN